MSRQPENGICALWLALSVALTMRLVPTGHFLFFASPKKRKQKKGDCGCRFGCAKLPSLHTIFRADKKLVALLLKQFCPFFPKNRVPLGCASRKGALW